MIIAQISDTHIKSEGQLAYRRVDTAAYLERAVRHLLALQPRPDLVLGTGDLVDAGLPQEYARLRALLAPLTMPVYLIPGNHDDRGALAAAFPQHRYLPRDGFMQYVIEEYPLRLVALDTLVPGKGGGLLCDERLAWLAARLDEAPARPTLIFMHHPPFLTGIAHMDRLGLENAEALGAVIRRHPQVEAIVCGHLHRPIQRRWNGTIALTSPSTAHQVALDLRPEGASAFVMEPPACLLHLWQPDTGLVTHTTYVGRFEGPYPFHEGGKLIP
jgi:3',5'-cyclic AMP phosphodiesterase CpdA